MSSALSNIVQLAEIQSNDTNATGQEAIVRLLQSRFKADQPYTQLGDHRLVVVNPFKPLDLLNDATLQAYGQHGYKDISPNRFAPPEPHVYDMATRVYLLMRRRSENQAVILSGMTGSGKSTTHHHLIKELLYLSTHTRKEEKMQNQILGVHTIFEAFGSAASNTNETASCLGQFQTLQFNERGRIIGCNTSIFLLDKHRISRSHTQQYTIFYQLLAGTTPDEKQALHMTHTNFNYLKQLNQRNAQRDQIGFNNIKAALKVCGFKTKTVAQMCQLLAAILHLGNVQFVDGNKHFVGGDGSFASFTSPNMASPSSTNASAGGHESCRIKNKEILTLVAAALGVATSKLETTLTHKLKLIGNEFCSAFLTTDTASQQRDALAHTLYSVLVLWIMSALNQKFDTAASNAMIRTISILDTTGFQLSTSTTQRGRTFHDLCVNYTVEQLHKYTLDRALFPDSATNAACRQDGIWPNRIPLQIRSGPSPLALFHGTNKNNFALIPLMNKESKRFQTYALDATDSNLLSVLFQKKRSSQNNPNNDYTTLLNPSTPSYSFAIRHFDDTVSVDYSIDGFLESNLDSISPDFLHLFKYNCTNAFVHDLFEANSLAGWITDIHPRDERTVIKAQLPVWPSSSSKSESNNKQIIATEETKTLATLVDDSQKIELVDVNEEKQQQQPLKPRAPSLKRKKSLAVTPPPASKIQSVFDQVVHGVESLKQALNTMCISEIMHIRPNDQQKLDTFDPVFVQRQIQALHMTELAVHTVHVDVLYPYTQKKFMSRYRHLMDSYLQEKESSSSISSSIDLDDTIVDDDGIDDHAGHDDEDMEKEDKGEKRKQRILHWVQVMQWTHQQIKFGKNEIWLTFDLWRNLENQVRSMEKEARLREKEKLAAIEAEKEAMRQAALEAALEAEEYEAAQRAAAEAEAAAQAAEIAAIAADRWSSDKNPFDDDCRSDMTNEDDRTEIETHFDQSGKRSEWGDDDYDTRGLAEGYGPNLDMSKMMEDYSVQPEEQVEEVSISSIRRWWARFVYFSTWWVPSFTLKYIGKMSRQDVQMAWREKVTLCLLIFAFSGSIIFFIVGLSQIICPGTKDLYSAEDVTNHQTISDYWVSVRGTVYDMTKFVATDHGTAAYMAGKSNLDPLAGRDLSYTFPPPLSVACAGLVSDPIITVTPNETIVLGPFVHFSGPQQPERSLDKLRDPYWLNKYFGPTMNIYKRGDLVIPMKQIKDDYSSWGRLIASIDDKVYDLTDYMTSARRYPSASAGVPNYHYLDPSIETLFTKFGGKDATAEWNRYSAAMDEQTRIRNKACLDNVFYIGRLDYRESLKCTFVNYLLLSFAVVMSVVILVKFLAALQFGSAPTPEDHDKFVICQVPCYTEDEESLRKTIDSLTAMTYDDKHKLLFLIADGMIIGSGNDKPTPRILLDILGHDENDDPEALMFKSIGEGSKQLNYGKVYSGVYQHEGHVVPYVVVVKVGKSSERAKPGNRGKRDSQIICMNFLNKVHFDSEMSPLELEIYYHIKHIIGIEPRLYEYILMVDSDTEVYPDALNRLISCMLHDSRIIGLCGETELGNEDRSWTTMIQVYEYYISHHLVKSFESLFGSVTCLPGCFCMYRIRTASKHQPLIVSPNVIHAYSDNQVDTLHKKNLLHLGEDRYLTTLMMKNFPQYKMMFTPYAKCRTVAPDQWRVLLSQRRRWINSTIHNLLELILLQELCGFCCLSMRFVVLTDLIGTITLPSSVIYLIYLIYEVISGSGPIPTIALGMLAGAYGLQSLIFIFKRQWQHIGWMVIYMLAIPIFSFFIPLYAFWHFDDFSWGNTRVVVGDKKKQIIVTDDEKFDEKMIPLKKWAVYEQEMWETKTLRSEVTHSKCSVYSYDDDEMPSVYNRSYNDVHSLQSHPSVMTSSKSNSNHTMNSRYQLLPPLISSFSDNDSLGLDLSSVFRPQTSPSTASASGAAEDSSGMRREDIKIAMLPEDNDIEKEIIRILASSNLMTLTKKQVRDQLSKIFGVDLTIKKGFINATIERLLEQDF
ncbi:chitin synthase [Mucor ambiguus]|uniref:chitin synthase n=1 Tax=Mucor ambiguus TaxID=91626 RepID=A0A0C9M251_9FUNG|nr:chitin synthase [Mucor ambiguus]